MHPTRWLQLALGATATAMVSVLWMVEPNGEALAPLAPPAPPATLASPAAPVAVAAAAVATAAAPIATQRIESPARPGRRVVDALGSPIAGLALRDARSGTVVKSDDEGRFDGCGEVVVSSPGWLPVRSPVLNLCLPAAAGVMVAAPAGAAFGIVVDPDGLPVPDARLTWEVDVVLPAPALAEQGQREPSALRAVRLGDWQTRSDANGQFVLNLVPVGSNSRLAVMHRDFAPCVLEAPAAGRRLEVRLTRRPERQPIVGRVSGADGRPLANAQITAGGTSALSNEQGEFAVAAPDSPDDSPDCVLRITAADHAPYEARVLPARAAEAAAVEFRLSPLADVSGQLVDGHGSPRAGWWVQLAKPPASAPFDGWRIVGTPVRTAADGRFSFASVDAASCCIEAYASDDSGAVRTAVTGGPAVALRIDTSAPPLPERIVGTVRSSSGRPQAGVLVGLARPTAWAFRSAIAMHMGARAITDARGRFEIVTCGVSAIDLLVEGAACGLHRRALEPRHLAQPLEIVLPSGGRIEFAEVPPALEGTTLFAVDDAGRNQPIAAVATMSFALLPPRLEVGSYDLPPSARAVLLQQHGLELGRLLLR